MDTNFLECTLLLNKGNSHTFSVTAGYQLHWVTLNVCAKARLHTLLLVILLYLHNW